MSEQNQPEVDLYELSDEDFLKHMEAAKAAVPPAASLAEETTDQPRDEKGRFVSTSQTDEPEQVDEVVYRREIDLGDGGGKQVFEGATPEELIEKLADAQVHATRKIREQAAALKAQQEPPHEEGLTEQERWLLSQEMMTEPDKAFEKIFQKKTGRKLTDLESTLKRIEAFEAAQSGMQAEREFVENHPEYVAEPANGARMRRWLETYQLAWTTENIEKAYEDLSGSGLLKLKTETNDTETDPPPAPQRIAAPAVKTVTPQRKVSSGLSTKHSAAKPELTVQDLYDMPEDEFLKLGAQFGVSNTRW